jgi:hypothetical protein
MQNGQYTKKIQYHRHQKEKYKSNHNETLLEPSWPFFWDLLYVWNLPGFLHTESASSFLYLCNTAHPQLALKGFL